MKKSLIIFLQIVVVVIGLCAITFMLWEPHLEGRNVNANLYQIYFKDPFLLCAYIASTPFFVVLYQSFILLRYIGDNKVFSPNSVKALRTIKYCAILLATFIIIGLAYLFIAVRAKDDIAGGVAMGTAMTFASLVIATAAAVFERLLQNAVDIKSENDLTV